MSSAETYYHRGYLLNKTCLGSVESVVKGLRFVGGVLMGYTPNLEYQNL